MARHTRLAPNMAIAQHCPVHASAVHPHVQKFCFTNSHVLVCLQSGAAKYDNSAAIAGTSLRSHTRFSEMITSALLSLLQSSAAMCMSRAAIAGSSLRSQLEFPKFHQIALPRSPAVGVRRRTTTAPPSWAAACIVQNKIKVCTCWLTCSRARRRTTTAPPLRAAACARVPSWCTTTCLPPPTAPPAAAQT